VEDAEAPHKQIRKHRPSTRSAAPQASPGTEAPAADAANESLLAQGSMSAGVQTKCW